MIKGPKNIIKDSTTLRNLINKKMEEKKITARSIVQEAQKAGCGINEASFSRYRKFGNVDMTPSATDILWICKKLGIKVALQINGE